MKEVLPSEECINQHEPSACDFKERKIKDTTKGCIHEKDIESTRRQRKEWFQLMHPQAQQQSSQTCASDEGYWNFLKGALLEITDKTCGWPKGSATHAKTWGNDASKCVSEKHEL